MKRDGSIATVVKQIIDVFRERENYLLKNFQPQPLRTPNVLPRLPPEKLSKLIETITKAVC